VTAVAGGSRTLERTYGIPVAPISTQQFLNLVKDNQRVNKSALPFVITPHPVIGMPPEALYAYLEGNDPETGKRVIDEIVDALTKPPGGDTGLEVERAPAAVAVARQVLLKDTEDNLQKLFYEKGWTDGLPIILPTAERVQTMLAGTSHPPDEVVGEVFAMDTRETAKYTVQNIAVIAVMAGAKPEHFPVILAIASTRQTALMPSTTAFGAMLLVNGPIRNEISMNCGIGAFSAVNQANSVIGRAWLLMSHSWGYNRPGKTLWSSQGSNLTYNSMCCGENEERSVWEPFHVQKGYKPDESVVSIFRGWTLFSSPGTAANRSLGEELKIELGVMPPSGSAATIVIDPLVARNLKENQGFQTKQDYSRWLSQNVKMPAGRYWGADHIDMLVASQAYQGIEPYASWKKLPDDALIAPFHDPSQINIVVVGGETSPLWKASDYRHTISASIDVWRPDKSSEECADGTCGIPDPNEPGTYDQKH
jgi:hypothetical protein